MKYMIRFLALFILLITATGCSRQDEATPTQTSEIGAGAESSDAESQIPEQVRVGSLKGPTSIGLVHMMYRMELPLNYSYTMTASADELTALLASGQLDIALIPANVAAVLYQKTNGGITVVNINTLGVLYIVESGDQQVQQLQDLKGKTLYMTGKGLTPDYALQYLLAQNQMTLSDLTVEYKSEASEVAAILQKQSGAIGLLPQPFVTTALQNNDDLRIALDLTEEWERVSGESSQLVTGVTVIRNEFMEKYPDIVEIFLQDHARSVALGSEDLDITAELVEQAGIIKAAVAKQAYPYCNIVCITGDEMMQSLSGYLQTLYDLNPDSIGGRMPEEAFYYAAD